MRIANLTVDDAVSRILIYNERELSVTQFKLGRVDFGFNSNALSSDPVIMHSGAAPSLSVSHSHLAGAASQIYLYSDSAAITNCVFENNLVE